MSSSAVGPDTPPERLPEFLSIQETCAFIRRSRNVVYAAVKSGQLPSVRLAGKKISIPKRALLAVMAEAAPENGKAPRALQAVAKVQR